jgi:hypothetical protein
MNRLFKFTCPFRQQGCSRRFRSQGGRTYHIRTCHTNYNNITPPHSPEPIASEPDSEPVSPSVDDLNLPIQDQDPNIFQPLSPTHPKKKYHPWLTGEVFLYHIHSRIFDYDLQERLAMRRVTSYLKELPRVPDPIPTLTTGIRLRKRSNF